MFALAVLYRYAPSRDEPAVAMGKLGCRRATSYGSWARSHSRIYVSTIGDYEKTYGSLGALVVFLFWLFLTG